MLKQQTPATAESPKPRFFYGYVVVAAAFLVMVVITGTVTSFGVFLKPMSAEFGWERAAASVGYSISLAVAGFLFVFTGRLTDRFGPRLVVTVTAALLGLGYFLLSHVSSLWQFYLAFAVVAAGNSGGLVPMMSTAGRWFVRRRGLMTGIVVSGIGIGEATMPPMFTKFIALYGWRTSYIIAAIIVWVVLIIAAQLLRRDPSQVGQFPDGASQISSEDRTLQTEGLSRREATHTSQFWVFCAMYFCYGIIAHPTLVHIVPHATDLGITAVAAATVLSVIGGISAIARIGVGSVSDRIGRRPGVIVVFGLAALAFFWLEFSRALWAFYLFAIIFGFAYGGLVALEAPMAAELFGLKAHGAIIGLVHFGATIGGAFSNPLAGRLFDVTGDYRITFMLFVLVSAAGLILTVFLKPFRQQERPKKVSRASG